MPERRIHYSDLKPIAQFAKEHWSQPGVHQPFHGFEDKTPDKREQLKACRRQIMYFSAFFMEKGETANQSLQKVKEVFQMDPDAMH